MSRAHKDAVVPDAPSEQPQDIERVCMNALGHQAQVIIEIVPDLHLITGELPSVITLERVENNNRLDLLLVTFFLSIAPLVRPLGLFLDDLPWADSASTPLKSN